MNIGDAVLVHWEDARATVGWRPVCPEDATKVISVGILTSETDKTLTLAVCVAEDEDGEWQMNSTMVIPQGWIQKTVVLRRGVVS